MSATFNVQRFAEYFSFPLFGKLAPAPFIDLDKFRCQKTFMIHEYYLCQLGLLGKVSLLHVCKLDQPFLHEAILCDLRIILKPFVGWHCKRRAVCVCRCVLKHLISMSRSLIVFYILIRAHSSNKTGFSCFSAATFTASNVLFF